MFFGLLQNGTIPLAFRLGDRATAGRALMDIDRDTPCRLPMRVW